MSNKFSITTDTPKKPAICKSIEPPPVWLLNLCSVHVIWTDYLASPPNTFLDQTILLEETAPDSNWYIYRDILAGPGEIYAADLFAPLGPVYNELSIDGNDEGGAGHLAGKAFEPSREMPFNQTVELYSDDYPEPGSIIAHIAPVAK